MPNWCRNGGTLHKHATVEENRRCWFPTSSVPVAPSASSLPPVDPKDMKGSISGRQKKYINDLGGTWQVDWSYNKAHLEINRLLDEAGDRKKNVTDPRLTMISKMIDLIPDGYYATAAEGPGGHVDFLRVSRPNRGQYRGTIKIQTQHSEKWDIAMIKYPNEERWRVFKRNVVDMLLLVIADHHGCAKRYAIELQCCMVCNKKLTDDRSRHYLIGPVCDEKPQWKWVIEETDNKPANLGLSYEQLVARGLPTRVWQEREFDKAV